MSAAPNTKPVSLEIIRVDEPVDLDAAIRHYVAMCLEQIGVTSNRSRPAA